LTNGDRIQMGHATIVFRAAGANARTKKVKRQVKS
jgi:hypothetical protein